MQIIYNHTASDNSSNQALESIGVKRCYLKYIKTREKNNDFTKKSHHHTGFEVHIIISGEQTYEICDKTLTVRAGDVLIIPPSVRHRSVSISETVEKFSLTFDKDNHDELSYVYEKTPDALISALLLAKEEYVSPLPYSQACITSAVLFALSSILRAARINSAEQAPVCGGSPVFTIARCYIDDNICYDISTLDVADYCHLSAKQLTRIFERETGLTLGAYIRRKRGEKIRTLLENSSLSLKEISEVMNFKNEYYFNTFFKRSIGMSPGAYAKMVNK